MTNIILRARSPIQSWGKFDMPTLSGVNGFLNCCMGNKSSIRYVEDIAVAVINPGEIVKDFRIRDISPPRAKSSNRLDRVRLVSGGDFLIAAKYANVTREELSEAMRSPVWSPYWGIKAAIPTYDMFMGFFDSPKPHQALTSSSYANIVSDDSLIYYTNPGGTVQHDVPVSTEVYHVREVSASTRKALA